MQISSQTAPSKLIIVICSVNVMHACENFLVLSPCHQLSNKNFRL
uniref:Uncharacterized protein n=1 Tax=Arundo donax TaxID=35708 RepID=A0A0A8Y643_ARUDO